MRTRREAEQILKKWQKKLDLMHWEIHINYLADTDKHSLAERLATRDYHTAEIRLSHKQYNWREWPYGRLERLIVHELLHCFMHEFQVNMDFLAGEDEYKLNVADHILEMHIEKLAKVLTGHTGVGHHGLITEDWLDEEDDE